MTESGRRPARRWLGAPRWYVVSLGVLSLAIGVAFVLTGGAQAWFVLLVFGVVAAVVAIVLSAVYFLPGLPEPDPTEPPRTSSNGAQTVIGLGWTGLGVVQLFGSHLLLGAAMLGFGLLTALAFGIPWLTAWAARRRAAVAAPVEEDSSGRPPAI